MRGNLSWFVAVLVGSALCSSPVHAADRLDCTVENRTQGVQYPPDGGRSLAKALAELQAGDRIAVSGQCQGGYVIDKSLVLTGRKDQPPALLHGSPRRKSIVDVSGGARVTLRRLDLAGSSNTGMEVFGGAHVRAVDVRILRNSAGSLEYGGGLWVRDGAAVVLVRTEISNNFAYYGGGGIYNNGMLTLRRSVVSSNHVTKGEGGGIYNQRGTVVLRRTVVADNHPDNCYPASICE